MQRVYTLHKIGCFLDLYVAFDYLIHIILKLKRNKKERMKKKRKNLLLVKLTATRKQNYCTVAVHNSMFSKNASQTNIVLDQVHTSVFNFNNSDFFLGEGGFGGNKIGWFIFHNKRENVV